MEPKVSIILPVYNGADCIANSIDSILDQSYKDFELIIVNDCSTDNTWNILESYAKRDGRVKIYTNEVNLRLPRTLNEGFAHAMGEYLTWTSDDNVYEYNAIEEMVGFLDSNPECGMVYADMTIIDELHVDSHNRIKVAPEAKLLYLSSVCGACFMYRSDVAEAVGSYNPDLFLAEDYEYWIRISKIAKIMPLHKNLYRYRLHESSLTGSIKWEVIKEQKWKVLDLHFDYLYSLCENRDDYIAFFDNYIKCSNSDNRKESLGRVYSIMPEYRKINRTNSINYCKYRIKQILGMEK